MAWTRADTITIDHTKVPNTDQSNFPVLIIGTYSNLATIANGGVVTSASGYDIIFAADAAGVTPYKFERVSWNATTGACQFWVKVPTVSHTVDTVFYCLNGNSAVTTDQQDAANTWSANFAAVYHLDDNAATTTIVDSRGANNATNVANTSTKTVTGEIQSGLTFNGSTDDAIAVGSFTPTGAGCFSVWVKAADTTAGFHGIIVTKNFVGNDNIGIWRNGTNWYYQAEGASANVDITSTATVSTSAWTHLAISIDPTVTNKVITYVNGAVDHNNTNNPGTITARGLDIAWYNAGNRINALLDEIHISTAARSGDWIATEYNNQSSPGTFYTATLVQPIFVSKLVTYFLVRPFNTNPPVWPIFSFPDGYVGIPYAQGWDMPDASPVVTYTVLSGSLPPGLSLVALTGNQAEVSGTPTLVGVYPFTLRATNDYGVADEDFSITILNIPPGLTGGSFIFIN